MKRPLLTLVLALSVSACEGRTGKTTSGTEASSAPSARTLPASVLEATLLVRRGERSVTLSLRELVSRLEVHELRGWDPYYARDKRFRGLAVVDVLRAALPDEEHLERHEYLLRAKDGYLASLRGARLTEPGGYVVFEDLDVPGWERIGPQRADPAPFYLFWTEPEQRSLETHPRPWQIATIELTRFEDAFPKTVPSHVAESEAAWRGYALYKELCSHCHAINREGGRTGPELNLPRNITEYRDEEQLRAFIKDPLAFRYTAMPPHTGLGDADLDALMAYLRCMKDRKLDARD